VPEVHAEVKLACKQEKLMEQLLQPRKHGASRKTIAVGDGTPMCTVLQAPATLHNFFEAVFCADAALEQRWHEDAVHRRTLRLSNFSWFVTERGISTAVDTAVGSQGCVFHRWIVRVKDGKSADLMEEQGLL